MKRSAQKTSIQDKPKSIDDFQLEFPGSLREMVMEELEGANYEDGARGKEPIPTDDDSVDRLMEKVYQHIEAEALRVYNSNECWALKSWAYSNILKDVVGSEDTEPMVEELISPILQWQKTEFDPWLNFKRKMEASEYSPQYIKCCNGVVSKFIAKYGKKQRYNEHEILEYLEHLRKTYSKSSYATMVYRLKAFLDSLPLDKYGLKQIFPVKRLPKYPSEYYEPTFSIEDLESQAAMALIDESPEVILRLLLSQIYGLRLEELASIESRYINLDHGQPTITFLVRKRRTADVVPVTQPIPEQLKPFFVVPLIKANRHHLLRDLKRVSKKAGVVTPTRAGYHAIRRRVVTELWKLPAVKELALRRFIRWSTETLGVMPRYVQKPPEATDIEILEKHPCMEWWGIFARYVAWLPQYQPYEHVLQQIRP